MKLTRTIFLTSLFVSFAQTQSLGKVLGPFGGIVDSMINVAAGRLDSNDYYDDDDTTTSITTTINATDTNKYSSIPTSKGIRVQLNQYQSMIIIVTCVTTFMF